MATQRARDRQGRLARPFYHRACERKAVGGGLAARTYAPDFQAFWLETYDCVSYMPLVVFVGTTDDPVADDRLELAGLSSEPLRVGGRDAMLTQYICRFCPRSTMGWDMLK